MYVLTSPLKKMPRPMDDRTGELVETPVVVMLLVLMCSVSALWAVSCSWISGRKKRQRVADNADVDDMVLQIARPVSSSKIRALDRYSVTEPTITSPTDNSGSHVAILLLPIIVITPPSPTNPFVDVSSVKSDSSIGSADDLLQCGADDLAEEDFFPDSSAMDAEVFGFGKRPIIRDSMRNKLSCLSSSPSLDSDVANAVYELPSLVDGAGQLFGSSSAALDDTQRKSHTLTLDIDPPDDPGVLLAVSSFVVEKDVSFSCVALPDDAVDTIPPPPTLHCADPGTPDVELDICLSHHL
ncbi:unnamed protein product [Lymnaea stagnalis]|uniref:Secreted protein n=1 Tax=Lymnaea stagnalis TaxID=6523 RepID=A0AAV2HYC7_LYMST